jgi:tetratricopeptide (TPR) repeat protein
VSPSATPHHADGFDIREFASELKPRKTGLNWAVGLSAAGIILSAGIPNHLLHPLTFLGILVLGYALLFRKAELAYNSASRKWKRGDYRAAAESLRKCVGYKERDLEARFLLGLLLAEALDDPAAALPYAEFLARENPADTKFKALLVGCCFGLKEYDRVIETLQAAPQLFDAPGGEALQILLGRAFFETGHWDASVEILRKLPVTSHRSDWLAIEARYWLGAAHLKAGRCEDAKRWLTKVYAQDIKHRDVQGLLEQANLRPDRKASQSV